MSTATPSSTKSNGATWNYPTIVTAAGNVCSNPMANDKAEMNQSQELQRFYIFGHNISHSLSPVLHNTGFKEIGFPGYYSIHESPQVDESVETIIRQHDFRGASVTFPHKLQIGALLGDITVAARAVGAVNTVVVKEETHDGTRTLIGDNTDWCGIRTCISSVWEPGMKESPALVWGAGGAARAACYVLQTLGIRDVFVVNRSTESSSKMASHFPELKFRLFSNLHEANAAALKPIQIIVCCIPADDVTSSHIPETLFSAAPAGILVEMAYRPPVTAMMKLAAQYTSWVVFNGMDVLKQQAFAQFKLWTSHHAPMEIMTTAMENALEERQNSY